MPDMFCPKMIELILKTDAIFVQKAGLIWQ